MQRAPSRYYLYCQSIGWGMFLVAGISIGSRFGYLFVTSLIGLFITHILRNTILSYGWLNWPLPQGLPRLLLATILAAAVGGMIKVIVFSLGRMTLRLPWHSRILACSIEYILLFLPWTIMYCLYYQIQKTRQKNAEIRRLELLLQERSATAGDTAVDIESITRSLDRIRSLINEDAAGARAEITAFSQLLRKGYLKINDPQ
jgi:two-component system, LytTR family, sensor kinase